MGKYEKTTKRLRQVGDTAGRGWATGVMAVLSESGMFAYGVREVLWFGGASGFWVVVWLIATQGQGGKKLNKTEFWQRVDSE